MIKRIKSTANFLSEFSIPLISGVIFALIFANISPEAYHHLNHKEIFGPGVTIFGEKLTFHFIINDIFMVFFFGIAAVEIIQAVLPGGSLNPIKSAINPLMGTIGGVVGPVGFYFLLCWLLNADKAVYHGWGIPTATDIALAWLVARFVFGSRHPAVSFLLLLAIADDAIGLVIIAVFYPDPAHPVQLQYLGLVAAAMALAYLLRRMKVENIWAYLVAGCVSWSGLMLAHLHPALALVFILPFVPHTHGGPEHGYLFDDEMTDHSPLAKYEHIFEYPVDFGLFGFGLANAGVEMKSVSEVTFIVLGALVLGKVVGIFSFSAIAHRLGIPLPQNMNMRTLFMASLVAALGLTVALFVAGVAFTDPVIQGAAKMGALMSAGVAVLAIIMAKVLRITKIE